MKIKDIMEQKKGKNFDLKIKKKTCEAKDLSMRDLIRIILELEDEWLKSR